MTLLRNKSFVPLTASAPAAGPREFQVGVIPRDGKFHPFPAPAPPPGESSPADGKKSCEPRLSVRHDGDRVTSICVHCTCGQVLELACVYDEPPKPA